jgi:hypothetical protein
MNFDRFWVAVCVVCVSSALTLNAHGLPPGNGQDRGQWEAPPQEWSDIQRHGYSDGEEGARRDFENHRRPDVDNRDEYRHPKVPSDMWGAYREGFRRGYDVAMSHLMGGADWRMRAPERPWDAPETAWTEIERRGFQDGIEGARKDYDNHRRPDVNNREEYRNPHLPPDEREAYREGFRHGYERAVQHHWGEPDRY